MSVEHADRVDPENDAPRGQYVLRQFGDKEQNLEDGAAPEAGLHICIDALLKLLPSIHLSSTLRQEVLRIIGQLDMQYAGGYLESDLSQIAELVSPLIDDDQSEGEDGKRRPQASVRAEIAALGQAKRRLEELRAKLPESEMPPGLPGMCGSSAKPLFCPGMKKPSCSIMG